MRLERSGSVGMGIRVWMKKNKRKKQVKRKGKETYGWKESKKNNSIIKWYYNIFTIFHNKS